MFNLEKCNNSNFYFTMYIVQNIIQIDTACRIGNLGTLLPRLQVQISGITIHRHTYNNYCHIFKHNIKTVLFIIFY